jgi:hypothetical protein
MYTHTMDSLDENEFLRNERKRTQPDLEQFRSENPLEFHWKMFQNSEFITSHLKNFFHLSLDKINVYSP